MVGIGGGAIQDTLLDLSARAVERIIVTVIELVEQLDELLVRPGFTRKL
jgi:hypothetical protein